MTMRAESQHQASQSTEKTISEKRKKKKTDPTSLTQGNPATHPTDKQLGYRV